MGDKSRAKAISLCLKAAEKGYEPAQKWLDYNIPKHIVARGDDLLKIAGKYNVPIADLKEANNLETDMCTLGKVLWIPTTKSSVKSIRPTKNADSSAPTSLKSADVKTKSTLKDEKNRQSYISGTFETDEGVTRMYIFDTKESKFIEYK